MSVIHIAIFLLFGSAQAANWKQMYKSGNGVAITTAISSCPINYIGVPADPDYMVRYFCVAKYEMKNDGYGMPTSVATGSPWVTIARQRAYQACTNLGGKYGLISNSQWQTIARNITLTASNWSTGTVYTGELNRGHSDNTPSILLQLSLMTMTHVMEPDKHAPARHGYHNEELINFQMEMSSGILPAMSLNG